jgi:late competence protein required for DNA uptake (superfamily II DNA/RNA helicase)
MILDHKVTDIYLIIDEFFKEFDKTIKEHSLSGEQTNKRNRKFTMSESEVMTILILFHSASFKNLKSFYLFYVQKHMQRDFPRTVSYNRFIELQRKVCVPLAIFVKMMCLGKCTGISFI